MGFPERSKGLSSQAQETLFGRQAEEEEEQQEEVRRGDSPSPLRTRRGTSSSEEVLMPVGEQNMEITSPAHLWPLGAVRLRFVVNNMMEAAAMVGQCQELWRNLETGYGDRIDEVEALENRVSMAQLGLMEQLAEQLGTDLPEGYGEMSKGEASQLIDQMIKERDAQQQAPSRDRRSSGRRSSGRRSSGRRSSRGGSRPSSNRRQQQYDNDAPGGITPNQARYVRSLYGQLGEVPPAGLEDFSFNEASAEIESLEAELGIER